LFAGNRTSGGRAGRKYVCQGFEERPGSPDFFRSTPPGAGVKLLEWVAYSFLHKTESAAALQQFRCVPYRFCQT